MNLQETFGVTREETNLSSGTRLVLFKKPKSPISFEASFLAGSRYDPIGKEGLAHFAEHMIVSGTPSFPTTDAIAEFVANAGGYKNAHTGTDSMSIEMAFVQDDLESFIELFSEFVASPLVDEQTLEKERGAILQEMGMIRSSPTKYLGEISFELAYQNTVIGRSVIGTSESVNSITRQDILDYYKKYINLSNMVLVVAGDVELVDLKNAFEKYLTDFRSGQRVKLTEDLPIYREKNVWLENFKGDTVNLSIEFRAVNDMHDDFMPLRVLGSIFGGGASSILMKALRFKKGLVYGVSSGTGSSFDRGRFGIDTSFLRSNMSETVESICEEVRKLKTSGVPESEFQLARNKILKSSRRAMQTSGSWVDEHVQKALFYPDLKRTIIDYLQDVEAVTIDDLNRVANKYLTQDNWYLSATGNVTEADIPELTSLISL